ncbi:MAG TPA: radical SAM protein [Syntrophomonadaceae bacterium]|nr:radical SAM protein [Syntrophomonadaceae bacterium]
MLLVPDQALMPLPHQSGVLLIHLLNRCNLSCRHCYMNAGTQGDIFLPKDLVIRSLLETRRLNIGTVYLSGGEPFLYRELPEVLSACAEIESLDIHISSNGTLISKGILPLLKKSRATIQISIDGPEAYHDQFRGTKGAFQDSVRGISLLINAKIPVVLVSTLCRDNYTSLPWLAEWAAANGIKRLVVQPLWKLGRGKRISDKRMSSEQMDELFLQLSDLGYAYKSRELTFGLVYRNRYYLLEHPCAAYACNGEKCHRQVAKEIKKLVIREDGTVLPEVATLNPLFALGKLQEGSLETLVNRYFHCGYDRFNELCHRVYSNIIPHAASPIIPWDEIISERSWLQTAQEDLLISPNTPNQSNRPITQPRDVLVEQPVIPT